MSIYDLQLTPRQERILRLRAQGLRLKEIAQVMGISQQTVKNHVSFTYNKLGAESLAECLIAVGWLNIPEETEHAAA